MLLSTNRLAVKVRSVWMWRQTVTGVTEQEAAISAMLNRRVGSRFWLHITHSPAAREPVIGQTGAAGRVPAPGSCTQRCPTSTPGKRAPQPS